MGHGGTEWADNAQAAMLLSRSPPPLLDFPAQDSATADKMALPHQKKRSILVGYDTDLLEILGGGGLSENK